MNYLQRYKVAVRQTNVSGFEQLDLLLLRDKIAQESRHFTPEQKAELATADQLLLSQAVAFHAALSQVTDLTAERQQRQPSPQDWWWYLDVLAQSPLQQRIASTVPVAV
jgi:hypothetical protein